MAFCNNNNIYIILNKYIGDCIAKSNLNQLSFGGEYKPEDIINEDIFISLKFKESNIIPCYLRHYKPFNKEDDYLNFMRDFSIHLYEFILKDDIFKNNKITKQFNDLLLQLDERYKGILKNNMSYWTTNEKYEELEAVMITNTKKILFAYIIE